MEHEHDTRMERFWSRLAVEMGKHAGYVALVGLALTLVAGYGITRLEFATGQDSYLNSDDQVAIDNLAYQELFGGQAVLVMFKAAEDRTITDIMSPANQAEMDRIAAALKDQPDCDRGAPGDEDCLIDAVVTPKTALEWTDSLIARTPEGEPAASPTESAAGLALLHALEDDTDPESQAVRQADSLTTLERLNAIPLEERTFDNPDWIDFLLYDNAGEIRKAQAPVFTDPTHTQMVVRLTGNASLDQEAAGATKVRDLIAEADFENVDSVTVTGAPYLLKDINDYLQGGMLQLGGIALVVMALILLALFDVRWRLLPLVVIAFGVTWAFGLAGYLGIPLTLVTIAGLPIMLGIGIDYAIQMHSRVEEEVVIDTSPHPIQETARNVAPALLVVTFDAVFAFLALRWARVPMIRDFGQLLATGIAVICFTSIVLPLASLGAREYRSRTTAEDYRRSKVSAFTVWLGSLPIWAGPVLAVASSAVFFLGLSLEDDLTLQTDPVQWVDQDSRSIRDFRFVEEQTGSSSELGFFLQQDPGLGPEALLSQENVDFVATFADELLESYGTEVPEGKISPELLTATSLITTVDYAIEVPGATDLTPRAEDVVAAYELAPEDIKISTINAEAGAMNLIFRYGDRTLDERAGVVNTIRDTVEPPEGLSATPSGLAVVGVGLLENLEANRILLTYLSLAFVGLFLAVRLRSVVRSLLSLVPVTIAVGASSIVAFAFDLKLSPMTAVGGPLIVAACTEFTSLILLRFVEERRRGLWPRQAVDVAAARTGRAFIVSALTTMAGVLIIATSSLPLLRDFGLVVGMNVAVALLTALTVLPPLLVWADQRGWVSRGMVPEEVLRATTPRLAGRPEPTDDEAADGTQEATRAGAATTRD